MIFFHSLNSIRPNVFISNQINYSIEQINLKHDDKAPDADCNEKEIAKNDNNNEEKAKQEVKDTDNETTK